MTRKLWLAGLLALVAAASLTYTLVNRANRDSAVFYGESHHWTARMELTFFTVGNATWVDRKMVLAYKDAAGEPRPDMIRWSYEMIGHSAAGTMPLNSEGLLQVSSMGNQYGAHLLRAPDTTMTIQVTVEWLGRKETLELTPHPPR